MKKVIVACGNGVATSQTVAFRINRMLEKENITNVRVEAVNLRSLQRELHGALAYIDITNSHMGIKRMPYYRNQIKIVS